MEQWPLDQADDQPMPPRNSRREGSRAANDEATLNSAQAEANFYQQYVAQSHDEKGPRQCRRKDTTI